MQTNEKERADVGANRKTSFAKRKRIAVLLWTTQALLAGLFLFAGSTKLLMPIADMAKQTQLPGPFLRFIGIAEILGAIGLILPSLLRIRPMLTPLAATGLLVIMIGATVLTVPAGAIALIPLLTGGLVAFVAYGRYRMVPIASRTRSGSGAR